MLDVLIIGSGFSGIYSLKNCIYDGLTAKILEKSTNLGGVWNINNKPGGVHNFTFSVTSKLYLSSTDYPPPEDWPEFPHSSKVQEYLMNYVNHFKLKEHIQTSSEVINIVRKTDHWEVHTINNEILLSKNIVIATGVNMCPYYPEEEVFRKFTGTTVHSHFYDESVKELCKNKRVLIIGGSDTACDIANDIARTSKNVFVSIKNGQWFQDRIGGAHEAADMFYSRFVNYIIKKWNGKKPINNSNFYHQLTHWWGKGGSGIDIWQPKCEYINSYYNKSRDIIRLVSLGLVTPCGKVENITNNIIECVGLDQSVNIDVIIYATGYKYKNCMNFIKKYVDLPRYKFVLPIDNSNTDNINGTIAFIGYIRPYLTSIPMMIEFQTRLISKIFSNKVSLQNTAELLRLTNIDIENQSKEFPCNTQRIPFLVDPYDYVDSIAELINARPNYLNILWNDPFLYYCIIFDSWNQYVYRLNDPDIKLKTFAKETILKYHSNGTSIKIRNFIFKSIFETIRSYIILIVICYLIYKVWQKKYR